MAVNWQDRVPTYPNRYKATKSDGSYEYITLTRADEPTVVGTPINAANLNGMLADNQIKTYRHVGQIGCTSASTISEVVKAIPENSIFMVDRGTLTHSSWNFPSSYGLVWIEKVNDSRVKIMFKGKGEGDGDYIMYIGSNNTPTGTWHNIGFQSGIDAAYALANAAMPKGGGKFAGNVIANETNRSGPYLRNIFVKNSADSANVSTNSIKMVRK